MVISTSSGNRVIHYDSLGYPGSERPAILTFPLEEIVKWVKGLITPTKWDGEGWCASVHPVPSQPPGGNDCGVCTIMFCHLLLRGQTPPSYESFTPVLMNNLREALKEEMLDGKFHDLSFTKTQLSAEEV